MSDSPSPHRTRFAAAATALGVTALTALVLGAGPAPSVLQLAGASDDTAEDVSGPCDEAEHAADPECAGSPTTDGTTKSTVDDTTSMTAGGQPADEIRSLDAAGAGTVIYAVDGGNLRLITAAPTSGWAVKVEQRAGREVELDFRSGTQRVQVNLEIEDGQVRERVRFRDDADDTDIRTENGVIEADNSGPGSGGDDDSNSGPGSDDDDTGDDHSGSGHDGDDSDDDSSGSGRDHPEDD